MNQNLSMGPARYDFQGAVFVVTGAARGVGTAIVTDALSSGAAVVAVDRDETGLRELADRAQSPRLHIQHRDVADERDVEALFQEVDRQYGRVDAVINNAAVAPHAALVDEQVELWDKVFAVNSRGSFLMTREAARMMIRTGIGAAIVNFSSGVTQKGSPGAATYSSSRAATESLTQVAAIELAPNGIRVNCIRPGLIDTQPRPLPERMRESLQARIPLLPLARPGEPSEVSAAALWLCSDSASYVTGVVLDVDGGVNLGSRPSGTIVDDDPRYFWLRESEDSDEPLDEQ